MDEKEFEEYRNGRFAQMLSFYDARSVSNKRGYRAASVYLIVVSASLTPILALAPSTFGWRVAEALMSASLVAVGGIATQFKFHENWLAYRASWDALRREEQFRNAHLHEYKDAADRNALFVDRAESIFAREAAAFYARHDSERKTQPQHSGSSAPKSR